MLEGVTETPARRDTEPTDQDPPYVYFVAYAYAGGGFGNMTISQDAP